MKMKQGWFLAVLLGVFITSGLAIAGDGCYLCGSGSDDNIKQCKYHSSDTQDQRKKCKASGCKISGTASCSSASNVKVIDPH